jgi:hypothetical protein
MTNLKDTDRNALSVRLDAAGDKGLSGATINATCRNLRNPRFGDYLFGQIACLEEIPDDLRWIASD